MSNTRAGEPDDVGPGLAVLLRRLLDLVEAGELEADGWQGEAIRQRVEGAVTALELLGPGTNSTPSS